MSRLSTKARRARRRRHAFQSYMAQAKKIRARILAAPRATLLDVIRGMDEDWSESEALEMLRQHNPVLAASVPLLWTSVILPKVQWFKLEKGSP